MVLPTVATDIDQRFIAQNLQAASLYLDRAWAQSEALRNADVNLLSRSRELLALARQHLGQQQKQYHPPRPQMLERHLQQAEAHVVQGAEHVKSQQERVARLEHGGHESFEARALLDLFEHMQSVHIADRDRLRREIGK